MSATDHSSTPRWRCALVAKGRIAVLVMIALTAALLAGCGGGGSSSAKEASSKPIQGGTLNVTNGEENTDLNPLTSYVPADVNVISNIVESLWKENPEGKVVPWLVEKYEHSTDDRVWTLHLKTKIRFSTGKPMTSADVVFSLEAVKKSPVYGSLFSRISKIYSTSPSTVVITSEVPAPEMPLLLSQWTMGIIPNDFGGKSEKEFATHPVGTGPFKFVSWKKGESLTLVRNPYYWQPGLPHLDKIVFHTVEDPNSRASQLRGGELNMIYSPPWQQIASLESGPETKVGNKPLGLSYLIVLNVQRPLFKNIKTREAIDLALNREGMVKIALSGYGKPAGAYVSPPVYGYDPNIKAPEQNIEKARELLAEAVKEGVNPRFTLTVPKEIPFWATAAQIVQQNLDEAGFRVAIDKTDINTGGTEMEQGKADAFTILNYEPAGTSSELFAFYNAFKGNYAGADVAEMKRLLPEAQQEVNGEKRLQDYYHMQELVAKERNLIMVAFAPYVWAYRSNVIGYHVGKNGVAWFGETAFTR